VLSFQTFAWLNQVRAEEVPADGWNMETYIDLVGTVNYTHYADGSNYEPASNLGLGLTSVSSQLQQGVFHFALSIGYSEVIAWFYPDGRAIHDVAEMYSPDVVAVSLWQRSEQESDNSDNSIKLLSAYEPSNNLTVDTLIEDSANPEIAPIDVLGGNSSAYVDGTLVGTTVDPSYSKYEASILNFDEQEGLTSTPDTDEVAEIEGYGTENLTQTVYSWLARLIERTYGFDMYTVAIDDGTENITSEAITVAMNDETMQTLREIVDTALEEEEVTTPAWILPTIPIPEDVPLPGTPRLSGLSNVGYRIARNLREKGTFAFARGLSLSSLKTSAISNVRSAAATVNAIGGKIEKATIKAAISLPVVSTAIKLQHRASEKLSNFFTDASSKLRNTKFSFLLGPLKLVKTITSFFSKYWWLLLLLGAGGFIMFATSVGPYLYSKTIRKII